MPSNVYGKTLLKSPCMKTFWSCPGFETAGFLKQFDQTANQIRSTFLFQTIVRVRGSAANTARKTVRTDAMVLQYRSNINLPGLQSLILAILEEMTKGLSLDT